jgi:hypothetical protein
MVTGQLTLEELQQWEKEHGFVKDHYKNTAHNPEFYEYEEIINDEILMYDWYLHWLGE